MAIQIDMTPDGQFRSPPPAPVSGKLLRLAIVVAAVATLGAFAFLALWIALVLIPIAFGAALLAYGTIRYRIWRARQSRGGGSLSSHGFPPRF